MPGANLRSGSVGVNTPENLLSQALQRLSPRRTQWRAAHIRFSLLKRRAVLDYELRIARNTFESAIAALEGQLFKLSDGDLVFLYQKSQDISNVVARLHHLLGETGDPAADASDALCVFYDLGSDYVPLRQAVQRLAQQAAQRMAQQAAAGAADTGGAPLDPKSLDELVEAVGRVDLSNLIRKQTIYALLSGRPSVPLFDEKFISMEALSRAILPGHDLASNRWLFQYMTEGLDRRVLSFLIRNADTEITGAFSLNLNISTVLSPEFLTFDAGLTVNMRGSIVIELQAIDILKDVSAYRFAHRLLADRGYRICLDGVTGQTFPFLDRKRLGADFLKLQWSPSLAQGADAPSHEDLRGMVESTGRVNTILCHVDQEEAITFGRSIGIALYQGRHTDAMSMTGRQPRP